jgi:glycosyltransferase involved in cell wall biosynthesis
LKWTERQQYCYGLELIEMLQHLQRPDVSVLIVEDGTGREILQDRVPPPCGNVLFLTGRVPGTEVAPLLSAMDIGFITETFDDLGSLRLTTKLPEYLAAGLPVSMSPIPGFFDYARGAGWALPNGHPADPDFHRVCARWIDSVSWQEIDARRHRAPDLARSIFDYSVVRPQFTRFVDHVINRSTRVRNPIPSPLRNH